jgi:hypothetical protein
MALIIVWPKTMLYGRDIDCNLLFWPGYYTNAEPSGPNDDQGRVDYVQGYAVGCPQPFDDWLAAAS